MPAKIILIGGAAIVANYGFRDMTVDIDAVIRASSAMKEAIDRVGDRYGRPTLTNAVKEAVERNPRLREPLYLYALLTGQIGRVGR